MRVNAEAFARLDGGGGLAPLFSGTPFLTPAIDNLPRLRSESGSLDSTVFDLWSAGRSVGAGQEGAEFAHALLEQLQDASARAEVVEDGRAAARAQVLVHVAERGRHDRALLGARGREPILELLQRGVERRLVPLLHVGLEVDEVVQHGGEVRVGRPVPEGDILAELGHVGRQRAA